MYNPFTSMSSSTTTQTEDLVFIALRYGYKYAEPVRIFSSNGNNYYDGVLLREATEFIINPPEYVKFYVLRKKTADENDGYRLDKGCDTLIANNEKYSRENFVGIILSYEDIEDTEDISAIHLVRHVGVPNDSVVPAAVTLTSHGTIVDGEVFILSFLPSTHDELETNEEYLIQLAKNDTDEPITGENVASWDKHIEKFDYVYDTYYLAHVTNPCVWGAAATSILMTVDKVDANSPILAEGPFRIISEKELPIGRFVMIIRHATTTDIQEMKPEWLNEEEKE